MNETVRSTPDAGRVLGTALRQRWYVVVLAGAICAGGATYAASTQPVHYTAEARLLFGNTDATASQVPGYTLANAQLAATYARLATTKVVVDAAAADLAAAGQGPIVTYSVSPVADTPLLLIEATGTDQGKDMATVDAASQALIAYIKANNNRQATLDAATKQSNDAQTALAMATVAKNELQSVYDMTPADQRSSLDAPLVTAIAAVGLAQQQVTAAAATLNAATAALNNQVSATVVTPGAISRNDRSSTLSKAGLAGLVAGFLPGLAVAVLTATPRRRSQPGRRARTAEIGAKDASAITAGDAPQVGAGTPYPLDSRTS